MMPNYRGGNDPRASAIMTMFNRGRPGAPAGPPTGPGVAPQGGPAAPMGAPGMPAESVGEHLAEALRLIASNPSAPDVIPSLQSFFVALKGLTEPQSPQIPNPNGPVGVPGMAQNTAPAGPSIRGMRA